MPSFFKFFWPKKCKRETREVKCRNEERLLWRCLEHRERKSIYKKWYFFSFLEKQNLIQGLYFINIWACETLLKTCTTMTDVSELCIIQWFNYIKAVCCARPINCPIQFGGPGIVVQVDGVNIAKKIKHDRPFCPRYFWHLWHCHKSRLPGWPVWRYIFKTKTKAWKHYPFRP